ncbi:MAG: EscU/YscU/HrcU family type III secretion system export apparatus switch protein [Firmicutes bacterium]|nr:EscU/YscU/HrcU family type III secretion system export apparatus switch protein [Bacillota bacterium]
MARTTELGTALVLLAGFGAVYGLAGSLGSGALELTRRYLAGSVGWQPDEEAVRAMFLDMLLRAVSLVAPLMAVGALAGVVSQVIQGGVPLSGEGLRPRLDRLNPLAGLKRIVSRRALVDLLRSTIKVGVIGWIAWDEARDVAKVLPGLVRLNPAEAAAVVGGAAFRVGIGAGIALLAVAALDYWYQRLEHERHLRMSRQEVREDIKQSEGDPQVRARIRQRQRQLAARRMMQAVPTADVVITNPVHLAVALRYDASTMEAPVVVAKGAGPIARRIRELAEEHGVPLVEDPGLARALYDGVEVGSPIPVELYRAVADVLAFVYRVRGKRR